MRFMKALAICLLLVASCFSQSIPDRVKKFENHKSYVVEYDKFQKRTKIENTVRLSGRGKGFGVSTSFLTLYPTVRIGDDGEFVSITLLASGGSYRFHNQPTIRFLIDGNLIELDSDDIDDIVIFIMPARILRLIANAKLVEVQLGTFEGKFDAKTLTVFKNLYSLTISQPR